MTRSATRSETARPREAAASGTRKREGGAAGDEACSAVEEELGYLCPGPEWGPETTTCGRMLRHPGRCRECKKLRTQLRKADRRTPSERPAEPEPYVLALPAL